MSVVLLMMASCSKKEIKPDEVTIQVYSMEIQNSNKGEPPKMYYWIYEVSGSEFHISHHSDFKSDLSLLKWKKENTFPTDIYRFGARLNDIKVKRSIITSLKSND